MTSIEEFSFMAQQLAWLEEHLRTNTDPPQDEHMESALVALACARAVIVELAHLGSAASPSTDQAAVG